MIAFGNQKGDRDVYIEQRSNEDISPIQNFSFHTHFMWHLFSLCQQRFVFLLSQVGSFFLMIIIILFLNTYCVETLISSYSFNDIDLSLGKDLHIGLKLCILTGNSEILIKRDLKIDLNEFLCTTLLMLDILF